MAKISYLKIFNFKVFGEEIIIELEQPSVFIGPNNSGKTTAIQALALWNLGVKQWYEKKSTAAEKKKGKRFSVGINRLEIIQVPVKHTRFFWKNTIIRKGNSPIEMKIAVGLYFNNKIEECAISFKYRDSEVIYCCPDDNTLNNIDLLKYASQLNVEILYPMSGIVTEEALIQEGRINVLIGQGQTAEVLRNLCYKITENPSGDEDWKFVTEQMKRIFYVDLQKPQRNEIRGSVELTYKTEGIKTDFDISLAGRGLQQVLLLVAYIVVHRKTIILLDEPDAHLEILRQRLIFIILNELADKYDCQIIMATHSEVILETAADSNLILFLDGITTNLAGKKTIKNALKDFGVEHYYKAKISKHILYIEGSTDIEMLKAFAQLINHKGYNILSRKINYYYVKDVEPEASFEKDFHKASGYYQEGYVKHFYALKEVIPELKGIAIFDNDNKELQDEEKKDLAMLYWQKYELENYFAFPYVIEKYLESKDDEMPLFSEVNNSRLNTLKQIINTEILDFVWNGNEKAFKTYQKSPPELQIELFINATQNKKLSHFLDNIFQKFSERTKEPLLLTKGEYYKLIQFMPIELVDNDIYNKLDKLYEYLKEN